MRLAVLSDIHGNLPALSAVLDDMANLGEFDQMWCLGDLAALGGQPHECVQKIIALREQYGKDKLKVIGGNTDRYLVTGERFPMTPPEEEEGFDGYRDTLLKMASVYSWNLAQLTWDDFVFLKKILRRELYHKVNGYGVVIGFHAVPGNDEGMALLPDTDNEEATDSLLDREGKLAVCGHTHLAMQRQVGSWLVVNPGSVGHSLANRGMAEWACLTWENGEVTVDLRQVAYDVEGTLSQWESAGYPEIEWVHGRLAPQG